MTTSAQMKIHTFDDTNQAGAVSKAKELETHGYRVVCDTPKLISGDFEFNPTKSTTCCTLDTQIACSKVWVVIAEKT